MTIEVFEMCIIDSGLKIVWANFLNHDYYHNEK